MNILNNGLLFGPILGGGRRTHGYRTLSLDFAAQSYAIGGRPVEDVQQLLTVERATSKWVYNSSGQLVEVPANQPAYQHDPVTGEPQGLLIEDRRVNLLPNSNLANGWSPSEVIIETNVETAYDGTERIVGTFIPTTAGSRHFVYENYQDVTPDTEYTISVWRRDDAYHRARFIFRSSGTSPSNSSFSSIHEVEKANGYTREAYSFTTPSDCEDLGIRIYLYEGSNISFPGDGETGSRFDGVQLEEGGVSTTPIPTDGSQVTREGDSIYKPLGDEYNPNGFSVYAEAQQNSDTGSVFFLNNGGLSNSIRVGLPSNSDRAMWVTVDGSIRKVVDLSEFSNYTKGDPAKIALAVDPNNNRIRLTINGETVENRTGYFPSLDEIKLGGITANNNNISGTIHDYIMYPWALTASEAEEMTS